MNFHIAKKKIFEKIVDMLFIQYIFIKFLEYTRVMQLNAIY